MKLIYLISRVFWLGLFKIIWPSAVGYTRSGTSYLHREPILFFKGTFLTYEQPLPVSEPQLTPFLIGFPVEGLVVEYTVEDPHVLPENWPRHHTRYRAGEKQTWLAYYFSNILVSKRLFDLKLRLHNKYKSRMYVLKKKIFVYRFSWLLSQ